MVPEVLLDGAQAKASIRAHRGKHRQRDTSRGDATSRTSRFMPKLKVVVYSGAPRSDLRNSNADERVSGVEDAPASPLLEPAAEHVARQVLLCCGGTHRHSRTPSERLSVPRAGEGRADRGSDRTWRTGRSAGTSTALALRAGSTDRHRKTDSRLGSDRPCPDTSTAAGRAR